MWHYIWWVPITVAVAVSCAYASIQVNKNPASLWFWYMWVPLTVWPFITRLSTNIVFDGILYDVLVAASWFIGFCVFGATKDFNVLNYVGMLLAVVGLILIRV